MLSPRRPRRNATARICSALIILLPFTTTACHTYENVGSIGVIVDKTGMTSVFYFSCDTSEIKVSVFSGDGNPGESTDTTLWEVTDTAERNGGTVYEVGMDRPYMETVVPLDAPLDSDQDYTAWVRQGEREVALTFSPGDARPGNVLTKSGLMSVSAFGELARSSCKAKPH